MELQRIHFLSDFDLVLDEITWPDHDWMAKFYTNDHHSSYEASITDGVGKNCFNDNGKIHVVFNDHGLGPGRLIMITTDEWPNEIYPDGNQRLVEPCYRLNAELTAGKGNITEMHCEVQPPYIKGEKGDKGDKGDRGSDGAYLGLRTVDQTQTTVTIEPDVLDRWGEVAELTIDFSPAKDGYAGEYCIEFSSPATLPTTLSLPASVQFPYEPIIEAGLRYQQYFGYFLRIC